MKRLILLTFVLFVFSVKVICQTPISMSAQSSLTYTENFADITNWIFNTTPSNGTFTAGIGSQAWKGIDATTTTPAIPNATRVTVLSNVFQTPTGSGVPIYPSGVYKGSQSIAMYSSGTTDNSSSVAMDFFLDFTGVNAGTLSFDWNSLNNNTGNRTGSLRVYCSTDGINFTEITTAQVLNFVNNSPTAGSIANVALPSFFNGSATARLRFYYHNASGGTAGSRPRINIDNVKVTALPTTPCVAPTAQPTSFTAGTVLYNSINFSFAPASPAPQNYLVVISKNNALSSYPVNNTTYNIGDNLGDGTVVAITSGNTVSATGLTNSTTYYFFIFSMNNVCTGGPLYSGINPLVGTTTTLAGQLNCVAPTAQPTGIQFNNITTSSVSGSFTAAANTDEYLIVRTTSPTFTGTLNNGTKYSGGNVLGNGSVVTRTAGTTFTSSSLASGVQYYFFVFGLNTNNCNGGPIYQTTAPLNGSVTTVALPTCVTPTAQPTQLNLSASNNTVNGYFIKSNSADGYVVVRSLSSSLTATPTNGTTYTLGTSLGGGIVIANSTTTSFIDYALNSSTQYYYFVFAKNSNCTGGSPLYLTSNPLAANATTTGIATKNYYFGNLHAHSSYSDGNVDNLAFTPADDYAYAKNSLCMDFLGISEHNHLMSINNWVPGLNQAAAATTNNFLALYGIEYGVIANAGHLLIYGSNQLLGWDNGNYDVYVPKYDYTGTPESTGTTGLFRTINNLNAAGLSVFASFAHPDFSDYNNLSSTAYNAGADSAVVGCAVASGPAFSTNNTYSDPPTSMAYLDYYNRMLAKGYHIGPLMDHDSHYTNFGRSNNNRLAVVAPSLTSPDFFSAMKSRHFYATEDCDTKINFTINNEMMGSEVFGTTDPAISIYAVDPTSPTAVPAIRIWHGILGSGILPVQVANFSGNVLSFNDNNLAVGATGYYYADITIAGYRTITAPIWYTKTSTVPVKLLQFTAAVTNNRAVQLHWKTTNEINNQNFVVEKSSNGANFIVVGNVEAKNDATNNYTFTDTKPNEGVNYYRLKQIDKNGKFTYSNVIAINLNNSEINAFSVYPNPINDVINLHINTANNTKAHLQITDVFGRIIKVKTIELLKGFQTTSIDVANLKQGNYQVCLTWGNYSSTQKVVKF